MHSIKMTLIEERMEQILLGGERDCVLDDAREIIYGFSDLFVDKVIANCLTMMGVKVGSPIERGMRIHTDVLSSVLGSIMNAGSTFLDDELAKDVWARKVAPVEQQHKVADDDAVAVDAHLFGIVNNKLYSRIMCHDKLMPHNLYTDFEMDELRLWMRFSYDLNMMLNEDSFVW